MKKILMMTTLVMLASRVYAINGAPILEPVAASLGASTFTACMAFTAGLGAPICIPLAIGVQQTWCKMMPLGAYPPAYPVCLDASVAPGVNTGASLGSNVHEPWQSWVGAMDIGGSISRGVQAAIKLFLSDDNDLVAKLVYDGDGGPCGGNGGTYTGENGNAVEPQAVLLSSLVDIPVEVGAYPPDVQVNQTSNIADLAQMRMDKIVQERSSLDELDADQWAIRYRAQQRSIQAMTDALMIKQAYKELEGIADSVEKGDYSNYSTALSTVATRRLTLDALMALKKRVIAARVRARAETIEMNIENVVSAPAVGDGDNSTSTGTDQANTTNDHHTVTNGNDNALLR